MLLRHFMLVAFLLLFASPAHAQTYRAKGENDSSTVAVTNTFQKIQADNTSRAGCTVQNHGSNSMWVYFCVPGVCGGSCTGATKAKSVLLSTGAAVSCTNSNQILYGEVCVTGTSADEYYANFQ